MLQMVKGCSVPDPALLQEGYQRTSTGFAANVNAHKLQPLLEGFLKLHQESCFVILEVPTNAKEERPGIGPLHKDVYYLDDLTPERAAEFLEVFGPWLLEDGLSSFGFGVHSGGNEILVGKYNVVTVYTKSPRKYKGFFEAQGISETRNLKTAWDYFTPDAPGDSFLYTYKGKNIYDMVEYLKQYGLYFAERREV